MATREDLPCVFFAISRTEDRGVEEDDADDLTCHFSLLGPYIFLHSLPGFACLRLFL